tara:strand:+ start:1768 stop:2556 length:789 start_codon:yes stop_codon:yes gene_type:complete
MKISIFLPTIRTHLLESWYSSLQLSCSRHDFEVVFCGPFDIPETLSNKSNVKFIKDFGNPTRAAQLAAIEAEGDLIYHTVDDVIFYENILSDEIDRIEDNQITAMRYVEGKDHSGVELPASYWYPLPSDYANWPGVSDKWGIGIHFLMKKSLFLEFGGFDCRFEYLVHSTHDLLFRIQKNSNTIYRLSKKIASSADWQPETTGDHGPIHYAQLTHDAGLFQSLWFNGNETARIDLDNWKTAPDVWERRFDTQEVKSYEALYQ